MSYSYITAQLLRHYTACCHSYDLYHHFLTHIFFKYSFIFLSFCSCYSFAFISIKSYTKVFQEDELILTSVIEYFLDCARPSSRIKFKKKTYKAPSQKHTYAHQILFHQQQLIYEKFLNTNKICWIGCM